MIWVHPVCETRRQTPALGKDVTCTRNLKKKFKPKIKIKIKYDTTKDEIKNW